MTMRIDSVLQNAVNGVQQGLSKARQNSSQLAMAAGGGDDSEKKAEATGSAQKSNPNAKVVKASEATLGNLVDVEA